MEEVKIWREKDKVSDRMREGERLRMERERNKGRGAGIDRQ